MRLKNTWILLIIALAFIIYFVFIEQPRHQQQLENERLAQELTGLTLDDIYQVVLNRSGETLEFRRTGEDWRVLAPVQDLASRPMVNSLVAAVVRATIERTIPAQGENLAQYGLADPPEVLIRLSTASGDTMLSLHVGTHTITGHHCYARLGNGGDILILPIGIKSYAVTGTNAFRDDRVARFQLEDIKRFELVSADQTLQWQRDASGNWLTEVDGYLITGDPEAVEAPLRRLRGMRVDRFVSDDPEEARRIIQAKGPTARLWVSADNRPWTFNFQPYSHDSCYVRHDRNDRLVLANNAILKEFKKSVSELRDRRLLRFERAGLGRVRLETAEFTATIVKAARRWGYENPALGTIDPEQSETILTAMEQLKHGRVIQEKLPEPDGFGFNTPWMILTLWDTEDRIVDQMWCGEPAIDELRYVTSRSTRRLALMDPELQAGLLTAFMDLKTR